jgi:hypothetical protein
MLGFVLGEVVERYMFISYELYEWNWLTRPVVLVMLLVALYGVLRPIQRDWSARRGQAGGQGAGWSFAFRSENLNAEFVFNAVLLVIFINTLVISSAWDLGARLAPQVIGGFGTVFVALRIFLDLFVVPGTSAEEETGKSGLYFDNVMDFGDLPRDEIRRRGAVYFAWCGGYALAALVIGLLPAVLVFLIGYIRYASRESWKSTLLVAIPVWLFCYWLFHTILHVSWPETYIGAWFPMLNTISAISLF